MANYMLDILYVMVNVFYSIILGIEVKSKKELAKEELARLKLASDEMAQVVKEVKEVIRKSMKARTERKAHLEETRKIRMWRMGLARRGYTSTRTECSARM